MRVEIVEVEPGRFRRLRPPSRTARSTLPCPHVISDTMDAVEQVDGRFYTSKRAFRAVGRSLGLTEVGNEKQKTRLLGANDPKVKKERQKAIKRAVEMVKSV
jgi:predicted secreted Zn-dependent protease